MNRQKLISLATAMVLMLGLVACTTIPDGDYALKNEEGRLELYKSLILSYLGVGDFSVKGNKLTISAGVEFFYTIEDNKIRLQVAALTLSGDFEKKGNSIFVDGVEFVKK